MSLNGLYTTVKNTSGNTAVFGFLGPHGVRLADDATYDVPGDLVAALGGRTDQRRFKALQAALVDGDLVIVNSPAVYLTDLTTDDPQQIVVDNGVVMGVDPVGWDD